VNAWIVVLAAGVGSFAFRISVVALIDHVRSPDWIGRLATYVVPAAFAGLAATALAEPVRAGGVDAIPPIVAVVTTAVAARRHAAHRAFLFGLLALWAATAATAVG
jgi:branched-subunit amino acid transport protein